MKRIVSRSMSGSSEPKWLYTWRRSSSLQIFWIALRISSSEQPHSGKCVGFLISIPARDLRRCPLGSSRKIAPTASSVSLRVWWRKVCINSLLPTPSWAVSNTDSPLLIPYVNSFNIGRGYNNPCLGVSVSILAKSWNELTIVSGRYFLAFFQMFSSSSVSPACRYSLASLRLSKSRTRTLL